MKTLLRLGCVLFVLAFCLHCSAASQVSTNLQLTLELRDGSCIEIPMNLIKNIKVSAIPKPKPLPAGLVALWSGEGNANDNIGGNNGTLTGSASFGPGKVGQGFIFDGNNGSGVTLANPASLQLRRGSSAVVTGWFHTAAAVMRVYSTPAGAADTFSVCRQMASCFSTD